MDLFLHLNINKNKNYKDLCEEKIKEIISKFWDNNLRKINIIIRKDINFPEQYSDKDIIIKIRSNYLLVDAGLTIFNFKTYVIDFFKTIHIDITLDRIIILLEQENNTESRSNINVNNSEFDYEEKSKLYIPVTPAYDFNRVILPEDVHRKIEENLGVLLFENKVFNEWGLYEIQPHPSSALSFYGPSGTGKSMAAEAIANKLGKKILKVSYADVESKYHGEGPKMVKAIFLAAERNDAVLFFDEADSLLSKRLTSVTQGSEQAINSMRSQLLISLENFKGVVIFATNLVENYDSAFLTRLVNIEFKKPDVKTRIKIWNVHLYPSKECINSKINIPLSIDVDVKELAEKYEFVGREIRNIVISACVKTAMAGRNQVMQNDFITASEELIREKKELAVKPMEIKHIDDSARNKIADKIVNEIIEKNK